MQDDVYQKYVCALATYKKSIEFIATVRKMRSNGNESAEVCEVLKVFDFIDILCENTRFEDLEISDIVDIYKELVDSVCYFENSVLNYNTVENESSTIRGDNSCSVRNVNKNVVSSCISNKKNLQKDKVLLNLRNKNETILQDSKISEIEGDGKSKTVSISENGEVNKGSNDLNIDFNSKLFIKSSKLEMNGKKSEESTDKGLINNTETVKHPDILLQSEPNQPKPIYKDSIKDLKIQNTIEKNTENNEILSAKSEKLETKYFHNKFVTENTSISNSNNVQFQFKPKDFPKKTLNNDITIISRNQSTDNNLNNPNTFSGFSSEPQHKNFSSDLILYLNKSKLMLRNIRTALLNKSHAIIIRNSVLASTNTYLEKVVSAFVLKKDKKMIMRLQMMYLRLRKLDIIEKKISIFNLGNVKMNANLFVSEKLVTAQPQNFQTDSSKISDDLEYKKPAYSTESSCSSPKNCGNNQGITFIDNAKNNISDNLLSNTKNLQEIEKKGYKGQVYKINNLNLFNTKDASLLLKLPVYTIMMQIMKQELISYNNFFPNSIEETFISIFNESKLKILGFFVYSTMRSILEIFDMQILLLLRHQNAEKISDIDQEVFKKPLFDGLSRGISDNVMQNNSKSDAETFQVLKNDKEGASKKDKSLKVFVYDSNFFEDAISMILCKIFDDCIEDTFKTYDIRDDIFEI
ncbi:hypothetical protein EDEG_01299 [Edhazardia aedis USNM 41457]|uniref:Uncharacterized protein n=1 Tax=Edhazardia aedis (strain USNM 41457) TaxID=1003232 RepID=J9DT49_EDHAE|nr:hypothetical protein EDEG_01299 [Edhazardia aedis USNM 41457]|eukprot:EJW04482.1 hypothetical protein EDEG_01299 [Edhazardia aedis USNM 41457]